MAVRLALGTAQFGMDYGVTNRSGRIKDEELERVLLFARARKVDTIDTAVAYGDAESRLGALGVDDFRVVTKVPPALSSDTPASIVDAVERSLERLRLPRVHAVLLHRAEDLLSETGIVVREALSRLLSRGLTERVGVSVYRPEQLDRLDIEWNATRIELVQLPCNAFDRRMARSGWLDRLASRGVEVHARSAFLQGLLLAEPAQRPQWCARWDRAFGAWDAWCEANGADRIAASLSAAFHPAVARTVVGVESTAQFEDLVIAAARDDLPAPPRNFHVDDVHLLEPTFWPRFA